MKKGKVHVYLTHFTTPSSLEFETHSNASVNEQLEVMLCALKQSAEKHLPHCVIHDVEFKFTDKQIKDATEKFNRLKGPQLQYSDAKIHKLVTNYLKLKEQAKLIKNKRSKAVIMDTDMLFTGDITDIFDIHEFDICLTERRYVKNRINGGMIFLGNGVNGSKIYQEWVESADKLLADKPLFLKHYQKTWGICQASLDYMLENGLKDRYKVHIADCKIYNSTNDGNKSYRVGEEAKAIHFNYKKVRRFLVSDTERNFLDPTSVERIENEFYQYGTEPLPRQLEKFKQTLGYDLNIENPQTLNEKIWWKKCNDRNPLITLTSDKIAVREYVKKKGYKDILVPTVYTGHNPTINDIKANTIIKANNASCRAIICTKGKSKHQILRDCYNWRNLSYGKEHMEWRYYLIKPSYIIERLIGDDICENNFNFYCFHGKVKFINTNRITFNKQTNQRKVFKTGIYDLDWNKLRYQTGSKDRLLEDTLKRPKQLKGMIRCAEKLSGDFDFVRVDLMVDKNGTFYFSELTHYSGSGLIKFDSRETDLEWGSFWNIRG